MMIKSYSNMSYHTMEEPIFEPNVTFFRDLSLKFEEASAIMPFVDFQKMLIEIIKKCIKKAQVDATFNDALDYVRKWSQQYFTNIQINSRILLLEANKIGKGVPEEALKKINKVKHMIIDTEYEYLLTKVFVQEAKVYEMLGEKEQQVKCLKKCIEYEKNYAIQFARQAKEIAIQIADNTIIAYFQMFKQTKDTKQSSCINYLKKAFQQAQKTYGPDHFSCQNLFGLLQEQKNWVINSEKYSQKAVTEIMNIQIKKKSLNLVVEYSWQEELIIINLLKKYENQNKLIKEYLYNLKLDINRIKNLQNQSYSDWIQIKGSEISIMEEELMKIVDKEYSRLSKNTLKQLQHKDVFTGNDEKSSSSSEDDEERVLPPIERMNLLKFYRKDKPNHSRSKSRQSRN